MGCCKVDRRSEVDVLAVETVRQLIHVSHARHIRARVQQRLNARGRDRSSFVSRPPRGIPTRVDMALYLRQCFRFQIYIECFCDTVIQKLVHFFNTN